MSIIMQLFSADTTMFKKKIKSGGAGVINHKKCHQDIFISSKVIHRFVFQRIFSKPKLSHHWYSDDFRNDEGYRLKISSIF